MKRGPLKKRSKVQPGYGPSAKNRPSTMGQVNVNEQIAKAVQESVDLHITKELVGEERKRLTARILRCKKHIEILEVQKEMLMAYVIVDRTAKPNIHPSVYCTCKGEGPRLAHLNELKQEICGWCGKVIKTMRQKNRE